MAPSLLTPPAPAAEALRRIDDAIAGALLRHREAQNRLATLEAAPPAQTGWRASTEYQSHLALARRQCAEARAELRAARVRALNARMEALRTPARPPAPPPVMPQQQLLLAD